MTARQETNFGPVLHALSDLISSSDLALNRIGSLLSWWAKALPKSDFPVAVIGGPSKTRLLSQLYEIKKEYADDWASQGIRIIDIPSEEESSTEFLDALLKAKAVLMIIDASHVFSQSERQMFSALLGDKPPQQMLIVIDRINAVEEDEVNDLKAWIRKVVEPYFRDPQGNFNEALYARRLFYINRKDETTLLVLVEELNTLFTQLEERTMAAKASAIQIAALVVGAAQAKINEKQTQQQLLIDSLTASEQKTRQHFEDIRQREADFRQKAADISERIKFKLYSSLVHHLDSMHSNWEKDAPDIMDWNDIEVKVLLENLMSRSQREDFQIKLDEKVQKYLQVEFERWSTTLTKEIAEELRLLSELSSESIELQLAGMQNSFASSRYQGINDNDIQTFMHKMVQNILIGGRSLNQILMRLVMRVVSLSLILFSYKIFWHFTGAFIILGQEALGVGDEVEQIRHELLIRLRDTLLDNLRLALTTSGFSIFSFKNLDAFMAQVAHQDTPLLKTIYRGLPETVRTTLNRSFHTEAECKVFIKSLNIFFEKPNNFDRSVFSNMQLSPEIRNIFKCENESERACRLLLAEEFSDTIYPNLQDLLYATVDYQLSQYLQEDQASMQEQVTTARNTFLQKVSQAEAAKRQAVEEQERLQASMTEIQKHFDLLAVDVYGKPFTPEQVISIYANKKLIFGPLFD